MGSRSRDVLQVLQGLSSVLNQVAKNEGPAAMQALAQVGQHSKGVLGSLTHAAKRAAGSSGSAVNGASVYPPPSPYAPMTVLPKVTPQQVLQLHALALKHPPLLLVQDWSIAQEHSHRPRQAQLHWGHVAAHRRAPAPVEQEVLMLLCWSLLC